LKAGKHRLDPALLWARDKYLGPEVFHSGEQIKIELRKTLFSIVDDLLNETNQRIPFQPESLAPKRRIKEIVETELRKVNALLIPEVGGFLMKIRSDIHHFQKRFACAHEIGHTFFFNIDIDPPRREFQYQKSSYWVEEEFSCAIAREILLPEYSIRKTIRKNQISPSISAIRYLSGLYQASFDLIRLKVINDIPLWDCIIFRSSLSDGKAITRGRDISKGISYRDIRIPLVIEENSEYSQLFNVLFSTLKKKRLSDRVDLKGKEYSIETILLNYAEPVVMSILTTPGKLHLKDVSIDQDLMLFL